MILIKTFINRYKVTVRIHSMLNATCRHDVMKILFTVQRASLMRMGIYVTAHCILGSHHHVLGHAK